jgi:hypothetical protein
VISVRHRLSKRRGFLTLVGFSSQGTGGVTGALGGVAGQLAGGLGL